MLNSRHLAICVVAALTMALGACGQTTAVEEAPATGAEPFDGSVDGSAVVHPFCEEIGRRVPVEQCEDFTHLAGRAEAGVAAFNAPNPMRRGEAHTLQLAISDAPTPEEIAARQRWEREQQAATAEAERQAQADAAAFARAQAANTPEAYQHYLNEYPDGQFAQAAREAVDPLDTGVGPEPPAPSDVVASEEPSPAAPPPPTPSDTVDPLQGETVEYAPLVGRFMRAELAGEGFEITPLSPPSQEVLPDSVTTWNWRVVATSSGQRALTLTTIVEGCDAQGRCYPLRSTSHNHEVEVTVGALGRAQDFLEAAPIWMRLVAGVLTALAVLVGAWFGLRSAFRKGRQPN
jgi:hypothetical protein